MSPVFSERDDSLGRAGTAAGDGLVGVPRARAGVCAIAVLALMRGVFISLGAIFATATRSAWMPHEVATLLGGVLVSLGLPSVLVVAAGLFAGNSLVVAARTSGKVGAPHVVPRRPIARPGGVLAAAAAAMEARRLLLAARPLTHLPPS